MCNSSTLRLCGVSINRYLNGAILVFAGFFLYGMFI